jgi:hypothetical protein
MVRANISILDHAPIRLETSDFMKEDFEMAFSFGDYKITIDHSNTSQFNMLEVRENDEPILVLPTSETDWFIFLLVTENPYISSRKKKEGSAFMVDVHICEDTKTKRTGEGPEDYDLLLSSMTGSYTYKMMKRSLEYDEPRYIKGHEPKKDLNDNIKNELK